MGKWIYINGLLLLISLVFMYLHFGSYYQPPLHVYVLASLFWMMLYALGHYIFIYKMKPEKKEVQERAPESRISVNAAKSGARPKVVLKKERPKVDLKKKNDSKYDK